MDNWQETFFKPLIKRSLELLGEKHLFELKLRNIDRNTDKETWKRISQWLRVARNQIEQKIKATA